MQPSTFPPPVTEPWRWRVVWLMFLATMLNYMDRQALGATSEFVKNEFRLDEEGYGWLEFWFCIAYVLIHVRAGFVGARLHMRWLYALALLLWSAARFATGLADSVVGLIASRRGLVVRQTINWRCAFGTVPPPTPPASRGLAN